MTKEERRKYIVDGLTKPTIVIAVMAVLSCLIVGAIFLPSNSATESFSIPHQKEVTGYEEALKFAKEHGFASLPPESSGDKVRVLNEAILAVNTWKIEHPNLDDYSFVVETREDDNRMVPESGVFEPEDAQYKSLEDELSGISSGTETLDGYIVSLFSNSIKFVNGIETAYDSKNGTNGLIPFSKLKSYPNSL